MAETGFELISIALIKSTFERPIELNFVEEEVATNTGFKVAFHEEEEPIPRIVVSLTVTINVPTGGEESMSASAMMLGIFHINGSPEIDIIKSFGNVNAPAILYPFAREVIANLTMRADVPPVLLPTMNFAAAYQHSQQVKKESIADKVKSPTKPKTLSNPKSRTKPTAKE
jgi:preprotein translocase subunit SecB